MAETITIRTGSATDVIKVIAEGPQGPTGATGANGQGVPVGGSTGQVLRKASGDNYDTEWAAAASGGVSSVNGETGTVVLDGSDIDTSANDDEAAFVTQSFADGNGIYYPLPDTTLNSKRVYQTTSGHYVFFETLRWHITDGAPITANIIESSDDDNAAWPWLSAWSGDVDKAHLADVIGRARSTFLFVGDSVPSTSVSGLGTAAASDSTAFAAASHTHGNITNAGAIGTTSGLPLKTGTSGVLEAGAFGTSAGQFAEGNHTHAASAITSGVLDNARVNFAAPAAIGNTTPAAGNFSTIRVDPLGGGSGELKVGSTTGSQNDRVTINDSGVTIKGTVADGSGLLRAISTTAARIYDLPNASGTLALLETLPAGGSTNLWIPASAWIPKTTSGCGVDSRETTTNDQNFDELLFDTGSDEFADALVVMPSNYNNGGTITARFYWTAASGSGTVEWAIQGRAFANDDSLDTAAGTKQSVNDTLIAADDMHITSATSACTIGGTPAANTPIQFTIYRDVSEDTLAVDARLLGVEILFN